MDGAYFPKCAEFGRDTGQTMKKTSRGLGGRPSQPPRNGLGQAQWVGTLWGRQPPAYALAIGA
jgi:hypothetical protein